MADQMEEQVQSLAHKLAILLSDLYFYVNTFAHNEEGFEWNRQFSLASKAIFFAFAA